MDLRPLWPLRSHRREERLEPSKVVALSKEGSRALSREITESFRIRKTLRLKAAQAVR